MAPVFTVLMLCIGLGLTVTMDVKADKETLCGTGAVWHEYISFVVNVQALAIGLATLVWLLLGDALGTEVADGEG
jgi:putative exporter of polyketide antibiotics